MLPYQVETILCCTAWCALAAVGMYYVIELDETINEYLEQRKNKK